MKDPLDDEIAVADPLDAEISTAPPASPAPPPKPAMPALTSPHMTTPPDPSIAIPEAAMAVAAPLSVGLRAVGKAAPVLGRVLAGAGAGATGAAIGDRDVTTGALTGGGITAGLEAAMPALSWLWRSGFPFRNMKAKIANNTAQDFVNWLRTHTGYEAPESSTASGRLQRAATEQQGLDAWLQDAYGNTIQAIDDTILGPTPVTVSPGTTGRALPAGPSRGQRALPPAGGTGVSGPGGRFQVGPSTVERDLGVAGGRREVATYPPSEYMTPRTARVRHPGGRSEEITQPGVDGPGMPTTLDVGRRVSATTPETVGGNPAVPGRFSNELPSQGELATRRASTVTGPTETPRPGGVREVPGVRRQAIVDARTGRVVGYVQEGPQGTAQTFEAAAVAPGAAPAPAGPAAPASPLRPAGGFTRESGYLRLPQVNPDRPVTLREAKDYLNTLRQAGYSGQNMNPISRTPGTPQQFRQEANALANEIKAQLDAINPAMGQEFLIAETAYARGQEMQRLLEHPSAFNQGMLNTPGLQRKLSGKDWARTQEHMKGAERDLEASLWRGGERTGPQDRLAPGTGGALEAARQNNSGFSRLWQIPLSTVAPNWQSRYVGKAPYTVPDEFKALFDFLGLHGALGRAGQEAPR